MKIKTTLALLILVSISLLSFSVKTQNNYSEEMKYDYLRTYSNQQIEKFVREVFVEHADELVLNSKSSRLKLFKEFLSRFEIEYHPEYRGKGFKNLAEVDLNNKYNKNLKRDLVMDVETFNPLKYHFQMFSKKRQFFRFKDTDYIIIIDPIQ